MTDGESEVECRPRAAMQSGGQTEGRAEERKGTRETQTATQGTPAPNTQ